MAPDWKILCSNKILEDSVTPKWLTLFEINYYSLKGTNLTDEQKNSNLCEPFGIPKSLNCSPSIL